MWKKETRERVGDYGSGQALSDQQFAAIEPFIPAQKTGGRRRTTDIRKTLDAIFYVTRVGCQWRHLPPPPIFPPWQTTYGYFRLFSSSGALERIQFHLVMEERERLIALSQVMIFRLWNLWVQLHQRSPTRLAAAHPQFSADAGFGVGARSSCVGSSGL